MRKFDSNNELKPKKSNNLKIVISMIIAVTLVIIGYSFATFTTHPQDLQIISNQVGEFVNRDILLSVIVDDKKVENFPDKENHRYWKLVCDNNSTGTWDKDKWQLSMDFTQPDKCTIYFHSKKFVPDLSGNDNNGTSTAVKWDNEGITLSDETKYGKVDCGLANYDFEKGFTYLIRVRINILSSTSNQNVFGNWPLTSGDNNAAGGIGIGQGSNAYWSNLKVENIDGWKTVYNKSNTKVDEWHTVATTYDNQTLRLYLDGIEVDSQMVNGKKEITSQNILLGHNKSYVTISYALIYDRALDVDELDKFQDVISDVNKDGLLLYYDFIW